MIDSFTRYNHPQAYFTEGIGRNNKLSGKFVRTKFSDLIDKLPYINEILASCQNYFDELFEEASMMLISLQDSEDEWLLEDLL
jgi:hypothetical protein